MLLNAKILLIASQVLLSIYYLRYLGTLRGKSTEAKPILSTEGNLASLIACSQPLLSYNYLQSFLCSVGNRDKNR